MKKEKLKTEVVVKSASTEEERLILNPPRIVFGTPSIPHSQSIIMKVEGLKQIIKELDLKDEDSLRIEWFAGYKATEYSYFKKVKNKTK